MRAFDLFRAVAGRRSPTHAILRVKNSSSSTAESNEGQVDLLPVHQLSKPIRENIANNCPQAAIRDILWGPALEASTVKELASAAIAQGQAGTLDALAKRYPATITADVISQQISSPNNSGLHYDLLELNADHKITSAAVHALLTPEPKKDQTTLLSEEPATLSAFVDKVPEGVTTVVAVRSTEQYAGKTSFFSVHRNNTVPTAKSLFDASFEPFIPDFF